jgi:hypothetical protein
LFLPVIGYTLSTTKLEIRTEQSLPGSEGIGGEEGGRRQGGEMTQTLYAHMSTQKNKLINKVVYRLM